MSHNQPLGWEPQSTWVFAVGTLKWQHADYFSPFPKMNRRDAELVAFFRAQGVPDTQIVYLQDRQATAQRIQQRMAAHLAQASAGDLLVLYYCGHGYRLDSGAVYFASYDADGEAVPGWEVATLPATIERSFRGARVLLAVDCCYSGTLVQAVQRSKAPLGYACLTSSLASESSTGNWTFTETLLGGLRGQAFTDADGSAQITLGELAEQIMGNMAFADEQLSSFVTTGAFSPQTVLARARPKSDPTIGRRIEAHSGGKWYRAQIIDARAGESLVHYYGWEISDDEWVTNEQIRAVTPQEYAVGAAVEVQWKKRWFAARVLAVHAGIHHIQYDGYSAEWNEWVAARRIRAA